MPYSIQDYTSFSRGVSRPTSNIWRCKSEEGHLIHGLKFWTKIYNDLCDITTTQTPFTSRLFVLDNNLLLKKQMKSWIQTSFVIGRQILFRGWKTGGGVPSLWLQKWHELQHLKRCHRNKWLEWTYMKESGVNIYSS